MKLVLVSDLHGQSKSLIDLEKIIKKEIPDAVVISGDISSGGDEDFLVKLFAILKQNNLPAFIICGNADTGRCQKMIDGSEYSIDQKCKTFFGEKICGLCYHEESLANPQSIGGNIFVSHQPPVSSLMKKKLQNAPKIHISGHLHTKAFVKKYPSTQHIQVPTLQDSRYAVMKINPVEVDFRTI